MNINSVKGKAIKHRKEGYSYGMISNKLGVAKSTLNNWLKDISYRPNKETIKRIKRARAKSGQVKHRKKIESIQRAERLAKKDIGILTKRDLFMLGIGLYWGEGDKASRDGVRITNSDSEIIKTFIRWFREICGLSTDNFTLTVYTYPNNDAAKDIEYWSKITKIPQKQFKKTQIDIRKNKSSKKRKMLPHGTLKLVVKSNGNKDFGVFLFRRIIGWIKESVYQTNKRV